MNDYTFAKEFVGSARSVRHGARATQHLAPRDDGGKQPARYRAPIEGRVRRETNNGDADTISQRPAMRVARRESIGALLGSAS
jgi:hypothetical protein